MTISEEQIVKDTFRQYSDAFEKLNPEVIVPFYFLPAMLIAPGQPPVAMLKEETVLTVFQKFILDLSNNNYKNSVLDTLDAKILSKHTAVVSGTATRFDTENKELGKFGYTYTLRKTDDGWKIIVGVIHDTDKVLIFE